MFPFISSTGNNDVVVSVEFLREDEKNDERVLAIMNMIREKEDWTKFNWEVEALPRNKMVEVDDVQEGNEEEEDVSETHVEEPPAVERRGKRNIKDPGSESRKKQLLCQRASEHTTGVSGEMKSFIEDLFTSSFKSLKEVMQRDIQERFDKVDKEIDQLNEKVSMFTGPSNTLGKDSDVSVLSHQGKASQTSKCPSSSPATVGPSNTLGKSSDLSVISHQGKASQSSQCPVASSAKGKGKAKAKAAESKDPPTVRRSPRPIKKVTNK